MAFKNKMVDEYHTLVTAKDLAQLPEIVFNSNPFNISTREIANADWQMRIISQKKIRRFYRLGVYPSTPHVETCRVTFFPGPYCPSKTHSVIHLKFPFFVDNVNDLFMKMIAKGDRLSEYISTVGMRLKCIRPNELMKELKETTPKQYTIGATTEVKELKIESSEMKAAAELPSIETILDTYGLEEILAVYNKKNSHFLKAKPKPKRLPPNNVVSIDDFREPQLPPILTSKDILEKFKDVI